MLNTMAPLKNNAQTGSHYEISYHSLRRM